MSSSLYHYSWDQCEIIIGIFKAINETDKKWLYGFNFLITLMFQIKVYIKMCPLKLFSQIPLKKCDEGVKVEEIR